MGTGVSVLEEQGGSFHCIKYARIRENKDQRKLVFSHMLCSVTLSPIVLQDIYLFNKLFDLSGSISYEKLDLKQKTFV